MGPKQSPEEDGGAAAEAPLSLERRATTGTILSVLNVGGEQIIRLAGNLITTRLLFPDAFGRMYKLLLLMQLLQMMSDVGIIPNIIQHERGEERSFLDTAWTMSVIRGFLITAAALAMAYPWSQLYGEGHETQLFWMIVISSSQGIISGFDSTKQATLNRRMQLGRLVGVRIGGQVIATTVAVVWAYFWPSVWALLAGAVSMDLTRMLMTHFALPGPLNRFHWEKEAARHIFHFGKWIFVSTFVTYLGLKVGDLLLGYLVDEGQIGIYGIGQNLSQLPILVTGQVLTWVLLPALSEAFREDRRGYGESVRRGRRVLNAAGVLMIAATAIGAPAFFYLLYDERWHAAGWMVQLLMLPAWFFFLQQTSVRVQLAMGDSRSQMWSNVLKVIGTIPGAWFGYQLGGLPGLLLGTTIGAVLGYVSVAWRLKQEGIPIFVSDMKWTLLVAVISVLGGATPWWIGPAIGWDPQLVSLIVGPLVLLPYGVWAGRLVLNDVRARRAEASQPS